jgi:peptide/nickel transport system substrate-binding protein
LKKKRQSKPSVDSTKTVDIPYARFLERKVTRRQAVSTIAKVGAGAAVAVIAAGAVAAYYATQPARVVTTVLTSTATATSTATTTTGPPTGPVSGGVVNAVMGTSFASIAGQEDPLKIVYTPDEFNWMMYDRLLEYKDYPSTDFVPALAQTWQLSPDGTTITLNLRQGVKWHDGQEFTSDDVKYSFDQYMSSTSGSLAAGYLGFISSVTAADKYTVKIVLKSPYVPAVQWLASFYLLMIPRHARQGNEANFLKNPIGTGPFKFNQENVAGSYISFLKNPNYWREGPFLDEVRWTGSVDPSAILAGFKSGQFQWGDVAIILGTGIAQAGTIPDTQIIQQNFPIGQYDVTMNTAIPPFDNQAVRQAVATGIDWGSILALYGGLYQRAYQPVTPDHWAYNPNATKYDYNLPKAQQMLTAAGVQSGTPITFIIYAGRLPSERDIVLGNLKDMGFNVTLKIVDSASFYSDWLVPISGTPKPGNTWHISMQSDGSIVPDPGPMFRSYLHSKSPDWNPSRYSNPQVDSLIDQGDAESDPTKRQQIYQQLSKLFVDAAVYPGTYNITDLWLRTSKLKGWKEHPVYQILVNDAYLQP